MEVFMKKLFSKDKKEMLEALRSTSLVLLGTFVLAFGIEMFIFPFDLVTGGISGIGIILEKAIGDVGIFSKLTAEIYSSIINWVLFGIGFFLLGKEFAAKTLISTLFYPFALKIAELIVHKSFMADTLNLMLYQNTPFYGIALIVATLFGGVCIGSGCALTFLGGGSTGGVDVIALTLSKYIKKLKSSVAFFIVDASVIVIGIFTIHNILLSLLGVISAFICASSIDKLFLGESGAFVAHVVSDKYEEINHAVIHKMSRTTTILDAVGGYSGENKKLVMISFNMRQYPAFTQIISSIDKNAFVTVHRAHEINGEGWTYGMHE